MNPVKVGPSETGGDRLKPVLVTIKARDRDLWDQSCRALIDPIDQLLDRERAMLWRLSIRAPRS